MSSKTGMVTFADTQFLRSSTSLDFILKYFDFSFLKKWANLLNIYFKTFVLSNIVKHFIR